MLEIFVQRRKEDVESALMQFVARRSYRISKPWYLEGTRIEAVGDVHEKSAGGFLAAVFDSAAVIPRIDVETRRKKSGTRVRIVVASNPESTRLAYELHSYLLDDRSFDHHIPTICPRCSSPVVNVTARYCGRCGNRLVADAMEPPLRSAPTLREPPPIPVPPATRVEPEPRETITTLADSRRDVSPPVAAQMEPDDLERSFERPIAPKTDEESDNSERPADEVSEAPDSANEDSQITTVESPPMSTAPPPEKEPMAESESEQEAGEPPQSTDRSRRALAED